MPELPEVETTVAGLVPVLNGHRLARVETRRADMRKPFPEDLRQCLTGARIVGLGRRAKYGLIDTDRGDTMIFHLGMSGRWRIDSGALGAHDHLVLETEEGRVLALNDPRRFGFVDLWPTAYIASYDAFARMGPEPLGEAFSAVYLKNRLAGRQAPIKAMLLDQTVVAGLGNIYVCEALNLSGIHPGKVASQISKPRLERLVEAIKKVLIAAIEAGGSSLRDYARPSGELGYFSKEWRVYGREGKACACGAPVMRRVDSGRSTFYCGKCQR